jgi:hypothetical protein
VFKVERNRTNNKGYPGLSFRAAGLDLKEFHLRIRNDCDSIQGGREKDELSRGGLIFKSLILER